VRVPAEKIDEVRNATDIVEVIGNIVKLKKRGKSYLGLCPFHTEKTPSFTVSAERQMYHCFGCGVGGNIFTFLMEYEKVSFPEALRTLAEKAGISLPKYSGDDDQLVSQQEQFFQILREAGIYYYQSLTTTAEGKFALDYFHQRGFSDETIRMFGLGYSPNSWNAFVSFAEEKKIAPADLEKAGLARRRPDGTMYDYFRGRAMFPVFSATGRVVGFGARKLHTDDPIQGKYINSPETLVYDKSKILYGLYQAKESVREKDAAILVEGYADLISVFQAGFRNVVASSGTALTKEQIQLISRYTRKITLVYDADSAGSRAALRGVDLIHESGLDVKVARLPAEEDPDSFVRKSGPAAFGKLLDDAVSFIDFIALSAEESGQLATPEGQAQTVRAIVQSIAKLRDELKRDFYIKQVAQKYRLYETTLYRELEKQLEQERRSGRAEERESARTNPPPARTATPAPPAEMQPAERDLLHAMIDGGEEIIRFIFSHLTLLDFLHPDSRRLAELILQATEAGLAVEPSRLITELEEPALKRLVAEIVFEKYALSKTWGERGLPVPVGDTHKIAQDAILVMRRRSLEHIIEENQKLLKEASRKGEKIDAYLERHQDYLRQLQEIKIL
jgi:DNA primase